MDRRPARYTGALNVREARRREAELELAQLPGQLAAARIEAGSFATHIALAHAVMLSAAEERAVKFAPIGERRYEALVDAFTTFACNEINLLAFRGQR